MNPNNGQLVDKTNLKMSYFNPELPTRFICHGWLGDGNSLTEIKEAYLKKGNFNIFMIDWSSLAKNPNYIYVRMKIPEVGQKIAEFIDFAYENKNLNFKNLYLIGHSLGGHIVGIIGKKVKKGRINTIIGLDPASFLLH